MKTSIFLLLIVLAVGACSPQSVSDTLTESQEPAASAEQACTTAACFISSASACEDSEVTLTQPGGTFTYSSTQCTLRKTLVALDPSDSQEMKNSFEGKSLVCTYKQGAFDPRWVNTLFYGLESCTGDLKEKLAWLLMLT